MYKIVCGVLLALLGVPGFVEAGAKRKPNIVVIVADDMGYADVGFQGCKDIPTPHIDALAKGGVRCTNGYVSGPYCSPTRAGLLTGRYQHALRPRVQPRRREARERRAAADRDDDRRPAQGGRLRHRPGRQVAPRRRGQVPPAEARLRRVLRLPRRRARLLPGQGRRRSCRGTSRRRGEGVPDRRLRPRGGRVHRPAQGRSRSSSTWRSTPSTRRCRPPTTGCKKFAGIADKHAAHLRGHDVGDGRRGRRGARQAARRRAWRRTR